jgi:two-component system response regulator NreC
MSRLKILIIDDHPTMIEGYKSILTTNGYSSDETIIVQTYNCEGAYRIITTTINPFDIVLLDMSLPPFESEKLFTGEDVAVLIKKLWPNTKIMMLTSHNETFILFGLIKKINPEGLLVKSDFTPNEFLIAFNKILSGVTYYSFTASQSLKDVYLKNNYLDAYNRRIISLLAKGIATKSLPTYLNISISAIDKRKAQIKDFFDIKKGGDEDIIREARKKGFI